MAELTDEQLQRIAAFRDALEDNPDLLAKFRDAFPELAKDLLDSELSEDDLDAAAGGTGQRIILARWTTGSPQFPG